MADDTFYIKVRPSTDGFEAQVVRDVTRAGEKAGRAAGRSFGTSFKRFAKSTLGQTAGGFLLAGGIEQTLRSTVGLIKDLGNAAKEEQQRSTLLAVSLKNLGTATNIYGQSIENLIEKESRAKGFQDTELTDSFIRLNTVTKDSAKAYKDLQLAEDISRQRKIPLTQAALLLARAESGVFTSIRRLGLTTPTLTKEEAKLTKERQKRILTARLLSTLEEKFGGTAAAVANTATGATDRLHVAIQELEEDIGTVLLPTITKVSGGIADFLGKEENQRKVQEEVNHALKIGGEVAQGFADGFKVIRTVLTPVIDLIGGTEKAIKLMITAMAVGKVAAFVGILGKVGPAAVAASSGVTTATFGIATAGSTAVTSAGRVATFRGELLRLGAIGAVAIVIDETINRFNNGPKPTGKPGSEIDNSGLFVPGGPQGKPVSGGVPAFNGTSFLSQLKGKAESPFFQGSFPTERGIKPLSTAQEFKLALGADPENLRLLKQQAEKDRAALAILKKRRADGKITNKEFVAQTLNYTNDLIGTENTINGINQKAADDAKSARDQAKQEAQDREQAARDEADRIASIKEARLQSTLQAKEATKGTGDDIRAHRALITYYEGEAKRLRARKDTLGALAAEASAASQGQEIKAIQAEQRQTEKEHADRIKQEKTDRRNRFQSLREARLQLRVQQAELKGSVSDQIKAEQVLVKYYSEQAARFRKTGALAKATEAEASKVSAQAAIKGLRDQNKGGGTSATEFFRDAISNFKQFGSSIAQPGGILSGQQARGAFAGLALAGAAPDRAAQILAINSSSSLTEQQKQTRILQLIASSLGARGAGARTAGKRGSEKATTLTRQQAAVQFGRQGAD